MKKKLKVIIPITILLLIGFMAYGIYSKQAEKEKIAEQIQTLPPITFYKLNTGELFTNENIVPDREVLIIHFHPDCDFCHAQLEEIGTQLKKFANTQILLISSAETDSINKMIKELGLNDTKNITLLHDEYFIFDDIFGKSGVPMSLIYNKEGKLQKQFKGQVKVEEILKYIN